MKTPSPRFPEMRLHEPRPGPPTVLPRVWRSRTPADEFARAAAPLASVPILLPCTTLFVALIPLIMTPVELAEMRLPSPASAPPMILSEALLATDVPATATPVRLGIAAAPAALVPI